MAPTFSPSWTPRRPELAPADAANARWEPATSGEAVSVTDGAAMRCGDDRIAGEPTGSPRRDSDSVRAPTAAERADGRGRAGQAI